MRSRMMGTPLCNPLNRRRIINLLFEFNHNSFSNTKEGGSFEGDLGFSANDLLDLFVTIDLSSKVLRLMTTSLSSFEAILKASMS